MIAVSAPELELWFVELDHCADGLAELDANSHRRIVFAQPASTSDPKSTAHRALRLILARKLRPSDPLRVIERASSGQPILTTPPSERPIAFSLSHTPTHALIGAMYGSMMGVDLELPRAISMTQARREIIESAAAQLNLVPMPREGEPRTLQAWVRLESLAKTDGSGIGHLLTAIGAVGGSKPTTASSAAISKANRLGLRVHDLDLGPDCYGAIAIDENLAVPSVKLLPANADAMRRALALS